MIRSRMFLASTLAAAVSCGGPTAPSVIYNEPNTAAFRFMNTTDDGRSGAKTLDYYITVDGTTKYTFLGIKPGKTTPAVVVTASSVRIHHSIDVRWSPQWAGVDYNAYTYEVSPFPNNSGDANREPDYSVTYYAPPKYSGSSCPPGYICYVIVITT